MDEKGLETSQIRVGALGAKEQENRPPLDVGRHRLHPRQVPPWVAGLRALLSLF